MCVQSLSSIYEKRTVFCPAFVACCLVRYTYNATEMVNIQQGLGHCDKNRSGQVQIGHVVQTNEKSRMFVMVYMFDKSRKQKMSLKSVYTISTLLSLHTTQANGTLSIFFHIFLLLPVSPFLSAMVLIWICRAHRGRGDGSRGYYQSLEMSR